MVPLFGCITSGNANWNVRSGDIFRVLHANLAETPILAPAPLRMHFFSFRRYLRESYATPGSRIFRPPAFVRGGDARNWRIGYVTFPASAKHVILLWTHCRCNAWALQFSARPQVFKSPTTLWKVNDRLSHGVVYLAGAVRRCETRLRLRCETGKRVRTSSEVGAPSYLPTNVHLRSSCLSGWGKKYTSFLHALSNGTCGWPETGDQFRTGANLHSHTAS